MAQIEIGQYSHPIFRNLGIWVMQMLRRFICFFRCSWTMGPGELSRARDLQRNDPVLGRGDGVWMNFVWKKWMIWNWENHHFHVANIFFDNVTMKSSRGRWEDFSYTTKWFIIMIYIYINIYIIFFLIFIDSTINWGIFRSPWFFTCFLRPRCLVFSKICMMSWNSAPGGRATKVAGARGF